MTNSFPLISILTPVYSAERYIERCVKSLMEQTYNNLEFVFVNDCTPDNSMNILNSVLAKYPSRKNQIKIIDHPINQGVAVARNTLLANATGDYLLWVDADDWIEKDTVDKLVQNAIITDADIICFKSVEHTYKGSKIYQWKEEKGIQDFISNLQQKKANTALWGRLMKRSLFTKNDINFMKGIDIGEDLLVLLKIIYYSNKIEMCEDVLYHRDYTNENSLVHTSRNPKRLKKQMENTKYIEQFFKGKLDVSTYINIRNIDTYLLLIYNACLRGNKRSYYRWKKSANALKIQVKSTENALYRFLLCCDNYYINRFWSFFLYVLICGKNIFKSLKIKASMAILSETKM